jgi:peptide/nickel transport system permease protein
VVRFLLRRLLLLIPVLWGAATLAFLGLHMVPGGIAQAILGEHATAEAVARIEHELGLDQPLYVQYWHFLASSAVGNFGISFRTHDPVFADIATAFPYTLAILITVIGFNLFGNGLREVLGGRSGGKPPG